MANLYAQAQEGGQNKTPSTQPDAAQQKTESIQRVQIRADENTDRSEDTASKTVIKHEEINRYGDSNLIDVLKRLPGITARGNAIQMRGFNASYVQILLNGEAAPPGFSLDNVDPELVERIEIVRSATAELGTRAIAGTINIVLKRVVHKAQREIRLGLAENGDSAFKNGNIQLSDRSGGFSYAVAASLFHSASDRAAHTDTLGSDAAGLPTTLIDATRRQNGQNNSVQAAPRFNWELPNGDSLSWQSFLTAGSGNNGSLETDVTTLGIAPLYAVNANRGVSRNDAVANSGGWIHLLEGGAKVESKLSLNWTRNRQDSVFTGGDNAEDGGALLLRDTHTHSSETNATLNVKYSGSPASGHALVVGWDSALNRRRDSRLLDDSIALLAAPLALDEQFAVDISRLALFAQDEWSIGRSWSVYTGLRWEGIRTVSAGPDIDTVHNQSSVLSPILQTLYKLPQDPSTQLRAALARTYKSPPAFSLITRRSINTDNTPTHPDYQGNPDLRPELAWGLDASIEHFGKNGLVLSASTFYRRIEDMIGSSLVQRNGLWLVTPDNNGSAHSGGVELEAKLPLQRMWPQSPALDVHVNVTRNWSRVAKIPGPDNILPGQTPRSGNIGLDWRPTDVPLTLGGNLSVQSSSQSKSSVTSAAFSSSSRSLDAYGSWKLGPNSQLRLSASNLLRSNPVYQSLFFDASGSRSDTSISSVYRAVRINFEYKFQ
jgi:outer membrane receptor protein involved in Fe transport